MAIKKGAFDLYTQERQLPNKKPLTPNKTNHFFDDINKTVISPELPQKQLINKEPKSIGEKHVQAEKALTDNINNGSQSVHNQFTDNASDPLNNQMNQIAKGLEDNINNGSQSVHNQFTDNASDPLNNQMNQIAKELEDNITNGSQSVHNQFTDNASDPLNNQMNQIAKGLEDNITNGSQSVHNQFTDNVSVPLHDQMNQIEKGLEDNINNGSQSVHNRFTDNVSDPVIDRGSLTEEMLKGNINNGAQLALDQVTHTEKTELNANISALEKPPKMCFSKLVGNQREIIIALYKNMRFNKSDTTDELTLESISKLAGVNQKSLKNTLFRLSDAGLIIRSDQKIGRGGWVKYQLNANIIREIQQKGFFR